MNNVFVYCEIEGTTVADVSLELLTKGRKLANQLGCQLVTNLLTGQRYPDAHHSSMP
jgi:electron transfer flavoprotein alpha subunit